MDAVNSVATNGMEKILALLANRTFWRMIFCKSFTLPILGIDRECCV